MVFLILKLCKMLKLFNTNWLLHYVVFTWLTSYRCSRIDKQYCEHSSFTSDRCIKSMIVLNAVVIDYWHHLFISISYQWVLNLSNVEFQKKIKYPNKLNWLICIILWNFGGFLRLLHKHHWMMIKRLHYMSYVYTRSRFLHIWIIWKLCEACVLLVWQCTVHLLLKI